MDQHAHYLTSIDRIYNGPAPTPRPEPIRVSGSLRWQHALVSTHRAVTPLKAPPLVTSAWGRDFYTAHYGNPDALDVLIRQGSRRMELA